MFSQMHITTVLVIAAVIWAILLLVDGVAVDIGWLKHVSTVAAILILVLVVFDKWVWRWRLLKGWFVKRPHVWGTWRATLHFSHVKPGTKKAMPPIEGYMVIWQVYSHIHMRLFTVESSSETLAVERLTGEDGLYVLAVVYRNTPRLSIRERSPIPLGAMMLTVEETPEPRMHGQYWTDRKSYGDITLTDRNTKMFQSFEAARRAFQQEG